MNKFVAIVYPDQDTAAEVYEVLQRMQKEQIVDLHDAAYATKDEKGKLQLHQVTNMAGEGAAVGGFWGMLIGLLFFAPVLGLILGAGAGALIGRGENYGLDKDFMKELSAKLKDGDSAIFVLATSVVADKVVPELSEYGGDVLVTSLPKETEEKLQKALSQGKMGGALNA